MAGKTPTPRSRKTPDLEAFDAPVAAAPKRTVRKAPQDDPVLGITSLREDSAQPDTEALASKAPATPAAASSTRTTARYNVTRPIKKADTYRLPLDGHALIRAEIGAAAENGDRLTKDDVVIKALRTVYGKKHTAATLDALIAEISDGMKK